MSRTKTNQKKAFSIFTSLILAISFVLLCVPNLSVFAVGNVQTQTIEWNVHNGGQTKTITVSSLARRMKKYDPANMLKITTKNNRTYTVQITNNPYSRSREAIIYFYSTERYIPIPNEKPLYKYVIKQDGKRITAELISAKESSNGHPVSLDSIPFYFSGSSHEPVTLQFNVKSNCPFKPLSSDELPASIIPFADFTINNIDIKQTIYGDENTLSPNSSGLYGTSQIEQRDYIMELDITRTYSKTTVVDEENGVKIYSGNDTDEGRKVDLYFKSIGDTYISAPVPIQMSNFLAFLKLGSSLSVGEDPKQGNRIAFKTALPEYAVYSAHKSEYIDDLSQYKRVNIIRKPEWTFTSWETIKGLEDSDRLPIAKAGTYYLCWDGYKHGYICIEPCLEDAVTNFQPVAEFDMTYSSRSDGDLRIYELDHKQSGYKRSTCYKLYLK